MTPLSTIFQSRPSVSITRRSARNSFRYRRTAFGSAASGVPRLTRRTPMPEVAGIASPGVSASTACLSGGVCGADTGGAGVAGSSCGTRASERASATCGGSIERAGSSIGDAAALQTEVPKCRDSVSPAGGSGSGAAIAPPGAGATVGPSVTCGISAGSGSSAGASVGSPLILASAVICSLSEHTRFETKCALAATVTGRQLIDRIAAGGKRSA